MKDGDVLLLENTRFHKGEEKNDPAFVDAARQARRPLCQRRLLRRASRARLDRGRRAQAAGLRGPRDAGRTRRADAGARHRRSGRSRRSSAAPRSRPSSTCSAISSSKVDILIIGGGMANTFLFAAGQGGRQVAVREGPRRHRARDPRDGAKPPIAASCCRSTRPSPKEFKAHAPARASSTSTTSPTTR